MTIAARLRFVMTATLSDPSAPKGSYTFRTNLMDISIQAEVPTPESASSEVRDMKSCGNNLANELEYQSASTSDLFTAVRLAVLADPV